MLSLRQSLDRPLDLLISVLTKSMGWKFLGLTVRIACATPAQLTTTLRGPSCEKREKKRKGKRKRKRKRIQRGRGRGRTDTGGLVNGSLDLVLVGDVGCDKLEALLGEGRSQLRDEGVSALPVHVNEEDVGSLLGQRSDCGAL